MVEIADVSKIGSIPFVELLELFLYLSFVWCKETEIEELELVGLLGSLLVFSSIFSSFEGLQHIHNVEE